jgi:hypothetical protein
MRGLQSPTHAAPMRHHAFAICALRPTGSRCAWLQERNVCKPAFTSFRTAAGNTREWRGDSDPGKATLVGGLFPVFAN